MAFDTYLKIEGVQGGATAEGMAGAMELLSFSWGVSNPSTIGTSGGGVSGGKASLSSFNFMKKSEAASATLFAQCCAGQAFPKATITLRKTGGGKQEDFCVYVLTNVFVDSIQWSGSGGGDDTPTESGSIAFAKVDIEYKEQDKTGKIATKAKTTYDVTKASK